MEFTHEQGGNEPFLLTNVKKFYKWDRLAGR